MSEAPQFGPVDEPIIRPTDVPHRRHWKLPYTSSPKRVALDVAQERGDDRRPNEDMERELLSIEPLPGAYVLPISARERLRLR